MKFEHCAFTAHTAGLASLDVEELGVLGVLWPRVAAASGQLAPSTTLAQAYVPHVVARWALHQIISGVAQISCVRVGPGCCVTCGKVVFASYWVRSHTRHRQVKIGSGGAQGSKTLLHPTPNPAMC